MDNRIPMLEMFGYTTIPEVIQNIHNIPFNIRLHNEYIMKTKSSTQALDKITEEELQAMVIWGTYLIQKYVNKNLMEKPADAETEATPRILLSKREGELAHQPDVCNSMQDRPWNKKPTNITTNIDKHHLWMGDSGSSCHFTNTDVGMFNWHPINDEIVFGDGRSAIATKKGSVCLEAIQRNGTKTLITLDNCKYVPSLANNLFSITRALAKGWTIGNKGIHIHLQKNGKTIMFDQINSTSSGFVMHAHMRPVPQQQRTQVPPDMALAAQTRSSGTPRLQKTLSEPNTSLGNRFVKMWSNEIKKERQKVSENKPTDGWVPTPTTKPLRLGKSSFDINEFHNIMGHVNETYLRNTAQYYGITLTGNLRSCVPCNLAKIHDLPISKKTGVPRTGTPGERIFLDVSYFPNPSIANNKYWLLIVDDATDMCWSFFLKAKSDLAQTVIHFLYTMRHRGTPVKYIRLDNSGENRSLQQQTTKLFMNLQYEYTAPGTPQQNGRVERKFAILYEYMRSFLNTANVPQSLRQVLWAEAANHATDVINGLITHKNKIPPYNKHFLVYNLRTFLILRLLGNYVW